MIEKQEILKASIKIASNKNWEMVTFAEIAEETGCTRAELEAIFKNKDEIVKAVIDEIDSKLEQADFGFDLELDTAKDRIFEVIMYRFDLLNENRAAIISMLAPAMRNPEEAWQYKSSFCHSMRIVLEKAEILPDSMLKEDIMVMALSVAYMFSVKTWLKDETEDMSKTMADLDKHLNKMFEVSTIMGKIPMLKTLWS